ncbi:unnamed protein product [Lactuca virosa]|uniref:Uncharacterized protein n=1 Tax=Lactuca virosa TaxID=75947 RepID=A0AAU9MTN7_9ASTR|nr:unnamed protein product [Lactuca virosa]
MGTTGRDICDYGVDPTSMKRIGMIYFSRRVIQKKRKKDRYFQATKAMKNIHKQFCERKSSSSFFFFLLRTRRTQRKTLTTNCFSAFSLSHCLQFSFPATPHTLGSRRSAA